MLIYKEKIKLWVLLVFLFLTPSIGWSCRRKGADMGADNADHNLNLNRLKPITRSSPHTMNRDRNLTRILSINNECQCRPISHCLILPDVYEVSPGLSGTFPAFPLLSTFSDDRPLNSSAIANKYDNNYVSYVRSDDTFGLSLY